MGPDADVLSTGQPAVDLVLRECRAWLAERGETVVGSGRFSSGRLHGSVHSDFGPEEQDKGANQDYAVAWWPRDGETGGPLRFVLAMADGLTTSFRSECGSALVCWVAARALVEAGCGAQPRVLAEHAFNEAGLAIGRLADDFARDPAVLCPEDQFLSTWKYILQKGGLFRPP